MNIEQGMLNSEVKAISENPFNPRHPRSIS